VVVDGICDASEDALRFAEHPEEPAVIKGPLLFMGNARAIEVQHIVNDRLEGENDQNDADRPSRPEIDSLDPADLAE
jgi:hypothetical protein